MADTARQQTDKELEEMEKYLSSIFAQAEKDLINKADKYMADFARLENQHKKDIEDGKWTQEQFDEWRKNKLLYGMHWTRLIDNVKNEMAKVNQTAVDYVNSKTPQIFALNYNSIAEKIENSPVQGYSFELIDKHTVENLVKSDDIILPPKKKMDIEKDKLWNAKQVNAQLLQGILQGESIPKIAGRMANVCNSNEVASIRNARTMVTAAENSGRQSGMNKAEADGIIFKKLWISAIDGRTRDTHLMLNGQVVNNGDMFITKNGELEFPGDWRAPACEVYNCRCSLGSIVMGFKKKLGEEFKPKKDDTKKEGFVPAKNIKEAEKYAINNNIARDTNFGRMELERANIINQTLERLREKYPTNTLDKLSYNSRLKTANAKACCSYIEVGPQHKDNGYWANREKTLSEYNELIEKYSGERYKGIKEAEKYVKRLRTAVKELEEELKYDRWSVSSVYGLEGTIIHEYGHVIADQYFGQINGKRANNNYFSEAVREQNEYVGGIFSKAKGNGDIYKISAYAATDKCEFFAETFAMYDKGEKLPDYIKEMIEVILHDGIL